MRRSSQSIHHCVRNVRWFESGHVFDVKMDLFREDVRVHRTRTDASNPDFVRVQLKFLPICLCDGGDGKLGGRIYIERWQNVDEVEHLMSGYAVDDENVTFATSPFHVIERLAGTPNHAHYVGVYDLLKLLRIARGDQFRLASNASIVQQHVGALQLPFDPVKELCT